MLTGDQINLHSAASWDKKLQLYNRQLTAHSRQKRSDKNAQNFILFCPKIPPKWGISTTNLYLWTEIFREEKFSDRLKFMRQGPITA